MDLLDAFRLGERLLAEHGLDGWRLELDQAKRRAGICRFGPRVIGLSAPLTRLHSEQEVRDTLLHEIAHALVGPRHGHDAVWQRRAREIGATATRCLPEDAPRLPAPWVGVCPSGHVIERHRRPERVASCRTCAPGFSVRHVFQWTFHGRPAQLHPNYLAELRALEGGRPVFRLGCGMRARITAPGRYHGRVGTVVKRGRTSYHLQLPEARVRVLFAAVEPA